MEEEDGWNCGDKEMSGKQTPQMAAMAKELIARMDKLLPPKMTREEHDKAVQQMWKDICDEADKRNKP